MSRRGSYSESIVTVPLSPTATKEEVAAAFSVPQRSV